jgi:hypothetical protein
MLQPMGVGTQGVENMKSGHLEAPLIHASRQGFQNQEDRSDRPQLFFRSILGGVENREDGEMASINSIGNNVRRAGHYKLARSGFASWTAEMRMVCQSLNRGDDPQRQSTRSFRLVLLDISADVDEVGDGRLGPDYSHDGGGSSRFLPQERSQRAVFSWDTTRPSRTSFNPLRIVASCHSWSST